MAYISLKSIAAQAGVSVVAVSRALRNQPGVSRALALKIKAIAEKLNYRSPAVLQEAMGQLRMTNVERFNAQIALCTEFDLENEDFFKSPRWLGLQASASKLGYSVERFFMPKYTERTLRKALRSRNIRGVFLADIFGFATEFDFLFKELACVYFGSARRYGLPMHFVQEDQFQAGKKTLQEVLTRGYRRIGFFRVREFDPEGLYRAGVYSANSDYIYLTSLEARISSLSKKTFLKWCKAEKIECVITMVVEIREWLTEAGYQIPRDMGLAHVNLEVEDWCGIDPLWEEISAAGVDKMVSMLRKGLVGCPTVQECILIEGRWREGATLKPRLTQFLYGTESPALPTIKNKSNALKCISLEGYANRSLTGPGGWFGHHPLQYCASGEHEVCGTRFQILDETVNGKAALIMASRHCPGVGTPNPTEVTIPIGRQVKAIHFLHACGWSYGPIRNFATYHFMDSKGRGSSLPLVDRRATFGPESDGNIQDWYPNIEPLTLSNVRPVHLTAYGSSALYSAYLYALEWLNPNPKTVIKTLRITSNPEAQTTLGILAITLVI